MPTDRPTILIVEDEADLAELIRYNFDVDQYDTVVAHDGRRALGYLDQHTPDLVILDVMLPHVSGVEIAHRLRSNPRHRSLPVLMLTAKGADEDQIEGLRAGADDYVTKPFSMHVLKARVEALLRRAASVNPEPSESEPTSLGPVRVEHDTHVATVDDRPIKLTLTEFRLLACLVSAQGRVMSRNDLIVRAIGPGITVTERTIDVHVASIRKKLSPYNDMIVTVRGVGYRMVEPATRDAAPS